MADSTTYKIDAPKTPFRLQANNGGGKVYVLKDVLRVGRYKLPDQQAGRYAGEWNVTPETLASLRTNFYRFAASGQTVPLIVGHDAILDRPGRVVDLTIDGDTLYARCEIDHKKYQLSFGCQPGDESPYEVSIEAWESFLASDGETYAPCLTHVAIVNQPVVGNQKPFKRLSQISKSKGRKRMAAEKETDDGEGAGGESFTVDEVKKLLTDAGFAMPDIATTKEAVMAAFLALVGPAAAEPAADEMETQMAATPIGQLSMVQRGRVVDALRKKLSAINAAQTANAKAAFEAGVKELLDGNRITPAMGESLTQAGGVAAWQLSMLAPFRQLPPNAARTERPTQGMQLSATSTPDAVKARQAEIAKRFGTAKA